MITLEELEVRHAAYKAAEFKRLNPVTIPHVEYEFPETLADGAEPPPCSPEAYCKPANFEHMKTYM